MGLLSALRNLLIPSRLPCVPLSQEPFAAGRKSENPSKVPLLWAEGQAGRKTGFQILRSPVFSMSAVHSPLRGPPLLIETKSAHLFKGWGID